MTNRRKLEGGLQWLHSAEDTAVQWMMEHGSQTHMTTTTTVAETVECETI